jgi:hypothetical protein
VVSIDKAQVSQQRGLSLGGAALAAAVAGGTASSRRRRHRATELAREGKDLHRQSLAFSLCCSHRDHSLGSRTLGRASELGGASVDGVILWMLLRLRQRLRHRASLRRSLHTHEPAHHPTLLPPPFLSGRRLALPVQ